MVDGAIAREKELKNWHRQWKINLITQNHPEWKDLRQDLFEWVPVVSYHPFTYRWCKRKERLKQEILK